MNQEDELQRLIITADFREAENLIRDNNLDVDVSRHGWVSTAAIFGALNGDVEFLEFLGERDPTLFNRRRLQTLLVGTYPDRSLLYYASKTVGQIRMINYLLQFCDCNGDSRISPLVQAVRTGDSFMVQALLKDGATVNENERMQSVLLLQIASARQKDPHNALEIVSLLLSQTGKQRVHTNQLDGNMETALVVAARHNLVDVAAVLIYNTPPSDDSVRDRLLAFEQAKKQQLTNPVFTGMIKLLEIQT